MESRLFDKTHRHPIFDGPAEPVRMSDLPDDAMLLIVEGLCRAFNSWTSTAKVVTVFGASYSGQVPVPEEVIAAKLTDLLTRGLVTGCPCGCRGDWELSDEGRTFLRDTPWYDAIN